jgi:uncharacterized membrane protein (UPF0127 family)
MALAGCGEETAKRAPGVGASSAANAPTMFKTAADFFPIKVGELTVRMQLAVHDAELARGLMGRRDLGQDEGMLFVFPRGDRRSFYMRNTPTPLDIGYFTSDGVLREIYPMQPFDETSIASRSTAIQFALEMNQGWYARHAMRPGAQLDLAALAAAMQARGFRLEPFGLAGKTAAAP